MNADEFKKFLIRSLDKESDPSVTSRELLKAGIDYRFGDDFREKVINKLHSASTAIVYETEFIRNLNFVFYRVALPGVAAILLLLISIFLMEGSLSFNSFIGLGNNSEESIISLITGY